MTAERRVLVHPDKQSLTGAAAARFITTVVDLLSGQPLVHVVVTGGSVGIGVLVSINQSEARDSVDWSRVHLWWGDERWLAQGDAERNETQARTALVVNIALPAQNVHPFPSPLKLSDLAGSELDAAAVAYAKELASFAAPGAELPAFDITLLGVGPDGHVASLFPDDAGVQVTDRTVLAVRNSPKPPAERLSLSLSAINSSCRVWMVLAGDDKAAALGLALSGADPLTVPVAGVLGAETLFFVDAQAAANVPPELISSDS
ncbi:MAG: 6-phosphogluconolactonase [Microbacteriaceae bacterium]|nr:6-phosphogluconolactonase [Microbacteriaceae bacterium]